jgi:putative Mn2+ efflux pump MntP
MNFISLVSLSLAMSADSFAAAVSKGATSTKPQLKDAIRIGLIFAVIQTLTPLIGWALGRAAAPYVAAWDHWIAFGLLLVLGMQLIHASFGNDADDDQQPQSDGFWRLVVTGFATSIDAMALGAGVALMGENIVVVALAVGLATLITATIGVMVGRQLGILAGKRAEFVAGLVLITIGTLILYEHTGFDW